MNQMMVHCSELPRLVRCPGSLRTGYVPIAVTSEAAEAGTELHNRIAAALRAPASVGADDAVVEFARSYVGQFPGEVWVETTMTDKLIGGADREVTLTGTSDVIVLGSSSAEIIDWKSGGDIDEPTQLMGYAYLLSRRRPEIERFNLHLVFLRDLKTRIWGVGRSDVEGWGARMREKLNPDRPLTVGDWCRYCPRSTVCEALRDVEDHALNLLARWEGGTTTQITPETAARLLLVSRRIQKSLRLVESKIRELVEREVALNWGEWRIELQTRRRKVIRLPVAWPILRKILPPDKLLETLSVSTEALEECVKSLAEPKRKLTAVQDVWRQLADGGGVDYETYKTLTIRRVHETGDQGGPVDDSVDGE